MKLYHATYRANLESIFENGLGAIQRKNWEISENGGVCFADDMELAISFCETAENVDEEVYGSGIVVLEVDCDALLGALLFLDPNYQGEADDSACYLYRGVVAPGDLRVVYEEKPLGDVLDAATLRSGEDTSRRDIVIDRGFF